MISAAMAPEPGWSLVGAVVVIVVGAVAKWWFDDHPTRADKAQVVFDRAMALMDQQQEDIASLRGELAVVREELVASRDDRTALRHELDACEARHSLLAAVLRSHGIDVPEEAG